MVKIQSVKTLVVVVSILKDIHFVKDIDSSYEGIISCNHRNNHSKQDFNTDNHTINYIVDSIVVDYKLQVGKLSQDDKEVYKHHSAAEGKIKVIGLTLSLAELVKVMFIPICKIYKNFMHQFKFTVIVSIIAIEK